MYNIGAIILAAGTSTRMGKPKLLLPYNDKPIVQYSIQRAIENDLQPIVCITGLYNELLRDALSAWQEQLTIHFNPQFEQGMSTSLQQGIDCMTGKVDAVIIFLADQPLLPNEVVQKVIQHYYEMKQEGIKIVRPIYNGQPGHPILFDSSLFHLFGNITGDEGGKSIIQQQAKYVDYIHFPSIEWGLDIDTPEDYATLLTKE